MRKTIIHLHSALPLSAAGEPPEWVQLVPGGTVLTRDGCGPYQANAQQVIAASRGNLPAVLDEMHATDLAKGTEARAAGWIVELMDRGAGAEGGVWGRVEWTPLGEELLTKKFYRGLSPAIAVAQKTGAVLSVLRASLTNNPNLHLQPLLQSVEDPSMDLVEFLRRLLGLEADADDATIRTALQAVVGDRTLQNEGLGEIATLVGAPAGSKPRAIIVALQGRLADAGRAGELQQTVTQLQSQVTQLQDDGKRTAATAAVDAAIGSGKGSINGERDRFITLHMQDPAGTQAIMDTIPSLHDGGLKPPRPGSVAPDAALTAEDLAVIQLMGVDAEAFKRQREKGTGPVELITSVEG